MCLSGCVQLLLALLDATAFHIWSSLPAALPQFWAQVRGLPTDPSADREVSLLVALALCLLKILGSVLLTRYCWRQVSHLWAYRRAKDPLAFRLQEHISFLPSPWVATQVLTQIQPDDAFKLIKEAPDTWAAAFARVRQEHPPTPLASLQISLTSKITIKIVGQNGRATDYPIEHKRHAQLIAYLADQPRGTWVSRSVLIDLIYRRGEETNFGQDTSRINKMLLREAHKAGIVNFDLLTQSEQEKKIALLEHNRTKEDYYWRLSEYCEVDIFPELQDFAQRIKQAASEVSIEECRKKLSSIGADYDQGLLGDYQIGRSGWPWLRERYVHYRSMWLFLLLENAQREIASIDGTPKTKQDREAFGQAAMLFGWAALATCGIFSSMTADGEKEMRESDAYLIKSLHSYRLLTDLESARDLYRNYVEQCKKRDSLWKPSPDIKNAWPEATKQAKRG
jgi:hypothetical protein